MKREQPKVRVYILANPNLDKTFIWSPDQSDNTKMKRITKILEIFPENGPDRRHVQIF